MGEINETLGRGKFYEIDGEQFEVMPATLGDLEEVAEIFNEKVSPVMFANFIDREVPINGKKTKVTKGESMEGLYTLLGKAFRGKCPKDKLKKLDRVEVNEIIEFFLIK